MTSESGRRRPRPVGVAILVAIGLMAVAVIAALSLDDGEGEPIEISGAQEVQRLVGGIRQLGNRLGTEDAPVTVEVFSDVQCEECADYQLENIDPLIEDEVRAGDVKLVFHHYSMDEDRPTGVGGIGAVAAGLQDHQWQFIELFFRNQDQIEANRISQEFLDQVANGILNLNVEQWQRDFDSQEVQDILAEDEKLAVSRRLPLQPAVVVDGDAGTRELVEKPSLEEIRAAIAAVEG